MKRFLLLAAASLVAMTCGGTTIEDASSANASGSGAASATSTGSGGASSGTTGTGGDACTAASAKSCTGPGECVLTSPDCCLCGMPELSDYVALNEASAPACVCQGPACGCASAENPNLAASCEGGTCVGWDVRQEDQYSACTSASDCRLRMGLDCCEPCQGSDYGLVAVRVDAEAALKAALCAPGEACSKCAPIYPADASADCIDGHCAVVIGL